MHQKIKIELEEKLEQLKQQQNAKTVTFSDDNQKEKYDWLKA